MNLMQYIHQVLIEENPWKECTDVRDRPIVYEEVADSISQDLLEGLDGAKLEDHISYWLSQEFGSDALDEYRVELVCTRVVRMIYTDEVKEIFYNG